MEGYLKKAMSKINKLIVILLIVVVISTTNVYSLTDSDLSNNVLNLSVNVVQTKKLNFGGVDGKK